MTSMFRSVGCDIEDGARLLSTTSSAFTLYRDFAESMDELPLDTSHPAVRDHLSLIRFVSHPCDPVPIIEQTFELHRLQVLTPLSLLVNTATVLICSLVVSPSIGTFD